MNKNQKTKTLDLMGEIPKIKVVMFGTIPFNFGSVSQGVEAVCTNLVRGFSSLENAELSFITYSKEINKEHIKSVSDNVKIYYLPYMFKKLTLLDFYFNSKRLEELIKSINPEIIHIQSIAPYIFRFRKFPTNNIVVTQHGVMKEELKLAAGFLNKLKFQFKSIIEQIYYPRFKNVVFISSYNESVHPNIKKVINKKVIYNPISDVFFSNESSKPIRNQLIYVGWISNLKNTLFIIEVLNSLKEEGIHYNLKIIGQFKEEQYKKTILNYIDCYNLSDMITFEGTLSQDEVVQKLDESEVFIQPSKQETLPMSIAEAMARGKIVLASNVGGVSEMFTNNESGFLFTPNNQNSLKELLIKLNQGSINKIKISNKAKEIAQSNFNSNSIAKQTLNFYKEILRNQ